MYELRFIVFFNSPEIVELQKQAKLANEELRDAMKSYQAWLGMQRRITPPPSDNSLIHGDHPEDTDQQGESTVENDENENE